MIGNIDHPLAVKREKENPAAIPSKEAVILQFNSLFRCV
jgi:hypothetical protein